MAGTSTYCFARVKSVDSSAPSLRENTRVLHTNVGAEVVGYGWYVFEHNGAQLLSPWPGRT